MSMNHDGPINLSPLCGFVDFNISDILLGVESLKMSEMLVKVDQSLKGDRFIGLES